MPPAAERLVEELLGRVRVRDAGHHEERDQQRTERGPNLDAAANQYGVKGVPAIREGPAEDRERRDAPGRTGRRQAAEVLATAHVLRAFDVVAGQAEQGTYQVQRGNAGEQLVQPRQ